MTAALSRFLSTSLLFLLSASCTVDDLPPYRHASGDPFAEQGMDMAQEPVEDLPVSVDAEVDMTTTPPDMQLPEEDMPLPAKCPSDSLLCGEVCAPCPADTAPGGQVCNENNECVARVCDVGTVLCTTGCCPSEAPPMWGVVDKANAVGKHNTLKFDSKGNAHISYYDELNGDLKLAHQLPGQQRWKVRTVASQGNVGLYNILALDANDRPHMAYFGEDGQLFYARPEAGGWEVERVKQFDPLSQPEFTTSPRGKLAIFLEGETVHLAIYEEDNGEVWRSERRAGVWANRMVRLLRSRPLDRLAMLALELESQDVHMVYTHTNELYYDITSLEGRRRIGPASSSFLATQADITLDARGAAHVTFQGFGRTESVLYYTNAPTAAPEVVAQGVTFHDLEVDQAGEPRILYRKNVSAHHAWRRQGQWTQETIDRDVVRALGQFSFELDASGQPHWSYARRTVIDQADGVVLASTTTRPDGSPLVITEVADAGSRGGAAPKALLDSRGFLHLMYISQDPDTRKAQVRYAAWNGQTWEIESVPLNAMVENPTETFSFALDSAYRPHVVMGQGRIFYFTWDTQGRVSSEALQGQSSLTFFPTIQLDSKDQPHVVHGTDSGIFMNSFEGGVWRGRAISSKQGRSYYSMLKFVIDPSDAPVVVFHDRLEPQVEVLTRDANVWNTQAILPSNGRPVTSPTALRVGPKGQPAVVLQQFDPAKGHDTLQLMRLEGEAAAARWVARLIEVEALQDQVRRRAASGLSLDVDREENVHLSYAIQQRPDGMRHTVYHAIDRGGAWEVGEVETAGTPNRGETQVRVDQAGRPWVTYGLSEQGAINGLKVAGWIQGEWKVTEP